MILKLIKIRLGGLVSSSVMGKKKSGTQAKISKGKLALFVFLYIYIAVIFASLAWIMADGIGKILIPFGFSQIYFGLFTAVSFSVVFILSIFETKATLYESRDNELLLSMPIKVKDIIVSRIFTVLIYNYAETFLLMMPVIIVYAVYGGSIWGIIGSITVSLFIPLFATAISSGVGYIVAIISRKFNKNTFITVILSIGFMAAYFIGYNYILDGINGLADVSPELAADLAENLGIFGVIGTASLLNPFPLVIIMLLSISSAAVAYIFISKNYVSVITKKNGSINYEYKVAFFVKKSLFSALVMKEFKAFFSSANYILNAGIGSVFGVAAAFMVFIKRDNIMILIDIFSEIYPNLFANMEGSIAIIASAFLLALSSMSFISAPALSLEGRNLWLLKSLPIPAKYILLAKTIPHITISSFTSVISSAIMIVALGISPVWWAFMFLIPLAGSAFSAFFCAVIGAAIPKFDYVSDVQAIKQSAASGVSMFSMMIISLGIAGGSVFLLMFLSPIVVGTVLFSVLILFALISAALLSTAMAKRFDNF